MSKIYIKKFGTKGSFNWARCVDTEKHTPFMAFVHSLAEPDKVGVAKAGTIVEGVYEFEPAHADRRGPDKATGVVKQYPDTYTIYV